MVAVHIQEPNMIARKLANADEWGNANSYPSAVAVVRNKSEL